MLLLKERLDEVREVEKDLECEARRPRIWPCDDFVDRARLISDVADPDPRSPSRSDNAFSECDDDWVEGGSD